MSAVLPTLTQEQRTELEAWEQRALSREDFEARIRAPWTDQEREDFDQLVGWFNRRYPTAGERLAAQRSLMAQWQRNRIR
ncbi:hypothetical protein BH11MYX1_BH11MYX1_07560 [soil metagenome]